MAESSGSDTPSDQSLQSTLPTHVLPLKTRIAYSVGHVLNDLCAGMWFTYLLVYFHFILKFNNTLAGGLLLVGQVADALATPFVGIESDRDDNYWLCKYGKRKTWHLVGTVCVAGSFPFLFIKCIGCEDAHQYAQFIYYSAFIVLFQFGWAATQVSHLSLIPDLTPLSSERVELNALRYAFTVGSNILVYTITWLVLGVSGVHNETQVGPGDAIVFQKIVLIVVCVGTVFAIIFHVFVSDPTNDGYSVDRYSSINTSLSELVLERSLHLSWRDWFHEKQFYIVGLLYMATRLYVNLSQVYVPIYIQDTLKLSRQNIAIIPLVMYVSGFVSSFLMKYLNKKIGVKLVYMLGGLIAVVAAIWIFAGEKYTSYYHYQIYGVAVVIGVASTTMLITSLAITNELIGGNTASGAFVFGAMSFLDKLSNGIAVIIIQDLHPCSTCCLHCRDYYEYVMVFVCGGSAVFGLLTLAVLGPCTIGLTRRGISKLNRVSSCDRKDVRKDHIVVTPESTPLLDDDDDDSFEPAIA